MFKKIIYLFIILMNSAFGISNDYSHLDPDHLIPSHLLQTTINYYKNNLSKISNQRFVAIIDFSAHNSNERFYFLDMESGKVESYLTAHGKNSDPDYDGFATDFSNRPDSLKTSLGFFLTAETYFGQNGYSLRLDGLSKSNSNARSRAIVIHGADYVTPSNPGGKIGRSFGCPALEMRYHVDLIDRLKDGALLYAGF